MEDHCADEIRWACRSPSSTTRSASVIGRLKLPRPGTPRSEAVLPTAGRSLFRSLRGLLQGLLNRRFGRDSHRSILRCGFLSDGRLVGLHCRSELCPPLLGGFNDSLATMILLRPAAPCSLPARRWSAAHRLKHFASSRTIPSPSGTTPASALSRSVQ